MFALGFQEQLMGILPGKSAKLILDARTITRSLTVNHTGKERGTVKAGPENLVHSFVRMKEVAVHLLPASLNGGGHVEIGESLRVDIAFLTGQLGKVDRTDIETRRSARLHPLHRNSLGGELIGNSIRGFLANAPTFKRMLADVHPTVQEGSGSQNKGPSVENCPGSCTDAGNYVILKEKLGRKIRVNA